jgi:hypothetical protein
MYAYLFTYVLCLLSNCFVTLQTSRLEHLSPPHALHNVKFRSLECNHWHQITLPCVLVFSSDKIDFDLMSIDSETLELGIGTGLCNFLSGYSVGVSTNFIGSFVRAGRPGFDSRQCKIFLFSTASRPALGSTQPPIQWVPGGSFPGGKAAEAWSWQLI